MSTWQRLVLRNCGGYLRGLNAINSIAFPFFYSISFSSFSFPAHWFIAYQRGQHYGLAVLAYNATNALMVSMNLRNNTRSICIQNHGHGIGCGALLIFNDQIINIKSYHK